jgi:hypothetical protein
MLKKATLLPTQPRRGSTELAEVQDAPFHGQGRNDLSLTKGWLG